MMELVTISSAAPKTNTNATTRWCVTCTQQNQTVGVIPVMLLSFKGMLGCAEQEKKLKENNRIQEDKSKELISQ